MAWKKPLVRSPPGPPNFHLLGDSHFSVQSEMSASQEKSDHPDSSRNPLLPVGDEPTTPPGPPLRGSMHYEKAPRFRGRSRMRRAASAALRCAGLRSATAALESNCSSVPVRKDYRRASQISWRMAFYLEGKTSVDTNELSPKEATQMSHDVKYIGMDVHKEAIVIAVLNGAARSCSINNWMDCRPCGERCDPSFWPRAGNIRPRNCCARYPASVRFERRD